MDQLPMPADLHKASDPLSLANDPPHTAPAIEPPSVMLILRLFVIPLAIVALAMGVMFLIGLLAGDEPSLDQAIQRLRNPGGERTAEYLVGPASKQRYLDAKTIIDKMKTPQGMSQPQRISLAAQLIDILDNHTRPDEGEVQHFLLLALGRAWQQTPSHPAMDSPQAIQSRQKVLATLLHYMDAPQLQTRKAAILATAFLAGQDQAAAATPRLIEKLSDGAEDIDVRIAAATVLGPLSGPSDSAVITALHAAMRDTDPRHAELVWSSALSLAQLNQPDVADTILKLLNRQELARLEYYDRESDPANPTFRKLNDAEQQRILINTMLGAKKLQVPSVQQRLRDLTQSDPSPRVREAGMEMLGQK